MTPPHSTEVVRLDAVPLSARAARRTVAESVGELDGDCLDEVLLCTSEVVTNAVEHGAPPIELVIEREDQKVRVEVHDASPLRPRVGDVPPEAVRGRGMVIVERCADRWGIEERAQEGKSVWFEIDLRDR